MYKVEVFVTYKESILDPQGEAIKGSVHRMGYNDVQEIRQGKYFEMKIEKKEQNIEEIVEKICDKILANPVMESYRYNISEVE
ncbi:phosphoribosylformylglycinamidine synthase subunit PurS [Facklamia sp. DSM 111018]|uniref:Phosphoribosylformylglycinamidine synthase subunit PurS n=1 Tax=Facklamia lactis TaxID=2749967 RepID=A0ABS0LMF1_9LACT|nr:phosphoribosylformylglycinamidine synthase subunit PurS [Facklamia lactis]MBG9980007.1 phosphoribosylformylglycinamidine synthase subunit PurS [Facklamia lactis]MBG9985313.1 phosphoribosylformylglycinamidine synthase subunit PurS [Facklamia lactis]